MASPTDVKFAKDMIKHHESAVKMGEKEAKNGSDKGMVAFAKNVAEVQAKEINKLKAFVKENTKTPAAKKPAAKKPAGKMKM